ncbi:copper homeostasis protein CutC [Niallia circulans]|uniref:PF03932 family protein CutC n=1 Tax=Niallia circulans TaxID=1397 RepID=A0A553SSC7_NIACI|nr:copper homeostasis protein CutC [Niallia circulans]TRZ39905.1 copper homeostasis protein CutC [Niallia circulans]
MIKEFCAENLTNIPAAINAGAKRIELCDNLAVGGTTPSYGVIKKAVELAHHADVTVMTMIRPRGGNFEYSHEEAEIMANDIQVCLQLDSDGVVFGCLKNGWIDEELTSQLISISGGMEITFHMAFDELSEENQFRAIDWLAEKNVSRILTHGGSSQNSIEANFPHLKKLIEYAANRIIILPGAGINFQNLAGVLDALQVNEVHGTKIVNIG